MRWNRTITLLSQTPYQDEEGAWHEGEVTERKVFCNELKYAPVFMGNLRSNDVRSLNNNPYVDNGFGLEVQLELRAEDYRGEKNALYEGEEVRILFCVRAGEYSHISLARRIGNG